MKKLVILGAILLAGNFSPAIAQTESALGQFSNLGNTLATVQKVGNATRTAREISNLLTNTLNLTDGQKIRVGSIFTDYIKNTNNISKLANSDMATYGAKLIGINNNTLSKLRNALTISQYAKLLNVGSLLNGSSSNSNNTAMTTANNLLGALGGVSNSKNTNNLSTSAVSVLTGLLANAK